MTKAGFSTNTLTNIPRFRHERDLNRSGSRMEIYETISHVSTNQVWLHINSASSRVYFRPFALFSFVARRANLPEVTCLGSLTPTPHPHSHPPSPPHDIHLFSFLIRLTPGMHTIVNPLPYSSLEIVSLNHPRLPASAEALF